MKRFHVERFWLYAGNIEERNVKELLWQKCGEEFERMHNSTWSGFWNFLLLKCNYGWDINILKILDQNSQPYDLRQVLPTKLILDLNIKLRLTQKFGFTRS